jgi:hypothetical protein
MRAAMVADPADYPWSSYRANALGERNPILSPHPLYLALAGDTGARLEAYRALFRTALDEVPLTHLRMALNHNQPFGNDRFYAEIEAVTGRRREHVKRGRPKKAPAEDTLPELQQQEFSIGKSTLAPFFPFFFRKRAHALIESGKARGQDRAGGVSRMIRVLYFGNCPTCLAAAWKKSRCPPRSATCPDWLRGCPRAAARGPGRSATRDC